MMPQYYGLTPSWPVYPNGTMLPQQQQQHQQQTSMSTGTPQPPLIRNQNTRPVTPQQQQQQQSLHDAASMQSAGKCILLFWPAFMGVFRRISLPFLRL